MLYTFGEEYLNFLKEVLGRSHPASGGRELQTRCKYCTDSSDPRSYGHMYISIPQNESECSLFYCQKCGAHGIMNNQTLLTWGIYNESIATKLFWHNKKAFKYGKNNKYLDREVYYLTNNTVTRDKYSEIKLKYINKRLGLNLSYYDLFKLKIVLNLNDILKENNITELTRDYAIVQQLDEVFLGFISTDNAFINMRKLVKDGSVYSSIDKKYINYNIFNKFDNTEKFYTVPCNISCSPERLKMHVAEGPFDILSILFNLRYNEYGKSIFTSITGGGYAGIAHYFITKMKLPYIELHLYPDNDKVGSDNKMRYIVDEMNKINTPVYIHRNLSPNEKDFGVSSDRIKESVYQLRR